jgi:hypothetical protein
MRCASASGSNANGYSNAELQALEDNTVTNSSSNLITGGLDYEIEANDVGESESAVAIA